MPVFSDIVSFCIGHIRIHAVPRSHVYNTFGHVAVNRRLSPVLHICCTHSSLQKATGLESSHYNQLVQIGAIAVSRTPPKLQMLFGAFRQPNRPFGNHSPWEVSHYFQLLLACLNAHQHCTSRRKVPKLPAVRTDHMNMGCPAEFICPITQEVMTDPVMVSETGQVRSGSRRTSCQ